MDHNSLKNEIGWFSAKLYFHFAGPSSRAKAELEGDWDVAEEEAWHAAAKKNASRATTFAFFDGMFLPLDDVPQTGSPRVHIPVEAAQSTNCPIDRDATEGLGVPLPKIDEEQVAQ